MTTDYDLLVIGGGNAGLAAAGVCREAGWRVAVVEARDLGGTCPLRGCVPKKVLVAAAEALDAIARAPAHGIDVGPASLDWAALIARERTFVYGVSDEFERSLRKRGIDVLFGRARFVSGHEVEVDGRRVSARKVLVAAGSVPRTLAIDGAEHLLTSDDLLERRERPASLVFIGAGVIAFELTHVLARAGTRVTLLEVAPRPLPMLDEGGVDRLAEATRALGVEIVTGVKVLAIEASGDGFTVRYEDGGEEKRIVAASVANGAGRVPAYDGLDLEAAGVVLEKGRPRLDAYLRSVDNPDVLFAGDAHAGAPQLSPVATYEGRIAARNLLGPDLAAPDYRPIPSVVFTVPALAQVGLGEAAARDAGHDVDVRVNDMTTWRSARTAAETVAWAKVLVDRTDGRILGAHVLGHGAPEVIHTFAFAIAHGVTAAALKDAVYAYPTFTSDVKFLV